jgi:hypothetical protein
VVKDSHQAFMQALDTSARVAEALKDQPDPDGAITDLIAHIEGERAWLLVRMTLGESPERPPGWLRRDPALGRSR